MSALAGLGALAVVALVSLWLCRRWLRAPRAHEALVLSGARGVAVRFGPILVPPIVARAEVMDLRLVAVSIQRRGIEAIRCRDGVRADVEAVFFVVPKRTEADVRALAASVGCSKASDPAVVEELFLARFSEALEAVFERRSFHDALSQQRAVCDELVEHLGADLQGYRLDHIALASVGPTPTDVYDPRDLLDARGLAVLRRRASAG